MSNRKLFGTDGARGEANVELTARIALDMGAAGATVLTKENKRPNILIARDTRLSCDMLEAALSAGISSVGADVHTAGVLPTPAVAYLVRHYGFDAGCMISASHNPFHDNGIKFFNREGYKLSDELEEEIEQLMFEGELPKPRGKDMGKTLTAEAALQDYAAYLKQTVGHIDLSGVKIALDCANGATYKAAPKVFSELGADITTLSNSPNGLNINDHCGSTHMDGIVAHVKADKPHIAFAFDGDGDRCHAVDENGDIIDGDIVMSIIANHLKEQNKLNHNAFVATVMSNLGLFIMAEERGLKAVQTKVGDRYVLEEMLKGGYNLGGEQSGHIIFLDHSTTGDGILTALMLTKVMAEKKQPLSELAKIMKQLPQALVNAKIPNDAKERVLSATAAVTELNALNAKFEGNGRVLVRPSGTEPLVRVMIEGQDLDDINKEAQKFARLLESLV